MHVARRFETGVCNVASNGGNMDNKELVAGATVYFPVFVDGALFSAGEGHALQGDGEVCLTAIETTLSGTLEFVLRRDFALAVPRAETEQIWITMGFHEDLDDAAKQALREMIRLITELTDFLRKMPTRYVRSHRTCVSPKW
jgi:acetamidase/formamidase